VLKGETNTKGKKRSEEGVRYYAEVGGSQESRKVIRRKREVTETMNLRGNA